MATLREWERIIPLEDRKIYEKAGFGKKQSFGIKPAILVIDVVESFTGSKPKSVLEAIDEYETSCGEIAWKVLPKIKELISLGRAAKIPIVYTKGNAYERTFCDGSTKEQEGNIEFIKKIHSTPIAKMIRPGSGDFIIQKTRASAFIGTVLDLYLKKLKVDSIITCGTSTSGCVRATTVDGFSYGYKAFVVEDCCFDRSNFFHLVSLFDMNAKYATVVTLEEVDAYLRKLAKQKAII